MEKDATDTLEVLGSLIPARVIRHLLYCDAKDANALENISHTDQYEAAVLFADISGFSALAEKLAADLKCAANAAEALSSSVGKSLEKMVAAICNKGGDVIKFAGDAILAVFPADRFNGSLVEATKCCAQVALSMLTLDLKAGDDVHLSVHCGVGAGLVFSYHVGGLQERWEYVITGDPVDQIGKAEPEAEAGEVVLSQECYSLIPELCIGSVLPSGNFKITSFDENVAEFGSQPLIFTELLSIVGADKQELHRMSSLMRCYVPRPVLLAIDNGQNLWVAELRICSTLFCKLIGLNFKSADDLADIQNAVHCVQEMLYAYEGTLCRFIVDDKGAGLLLAFGLPPYMHENDPVRAAKSAMAIHAKIKSLSDDRLSLSCSIGVTSGRVFCGTAGGPIRCEYTLHGTLVNLAARYMGAAKDGVLVGEQTYQESRHQVIYSPATQIKVKGKKEMVSVYRPSGSTVASAALKIEGPMIGRDYETKKVDNLLQAVEGVQPHKGIVFVQGEAGLGKSRLCLYALEQAPQHNLHAIYSAGIDTDMDTPFSVWKPILTQMFQSEISASDAQFAANKIKLMKEQERVAVLMNMIARDPDESTNSFRRGRKYGSVKELEPDDANKMRELYPLLSSIIPDIVMVDDNETTMKMKGELRAENMCMLIARIVVYKAERMERDEEERIMNENSTSKASRLLGDDQTVPQQMIANFSTRDITGALLSACKMPRCILIVVEDLQWVDVKSIEVILRVLKNCSRLGLMLTSRNSEIDPRFKDLVSKSDEKPFITLKLRPLDKDSLRKCMCTWLKVRRVPDKAIAAVYEKSGGHPLFSEELCKLMQETNALIVSGDSCKLSKEAQDGEFGLPDTISALMTSLMDRIPPSQQLVLKVASVIGMVFQKHELFAVMPRTNSTETSEESRKALDREVDRLVTQGLLLCDNSAVSHFRFKNAMMRESAYELLLFQNRQQLHCALAEFYEERHRAYLEPWYLLLANNFYLGQSYHKAILYLELAGNDAMDMHGMEQVWSCFNRLLSMDLERTKHIPLVQQAGWCRKVGKALLYLGKPDAAEDKLFEALHVLDLDCTQITNGAPKFRIPYFSSSSKPSKTRLVNKMHMFSEYVANKDCGSLLEASRCYEVLSTLDSDRESAVAQERRLNAVYLAEAAYDADKEAGPPPELARSYVVAAEFYAGQTDTKSREMADCMAKKASKVIEHIEDSETQVLVHRNMGAYAIIRGDAKASELYFKKAVWVSRFLNFDRVRSECESLHIAVLMLSGKLGKANSVASARCKHHSSSTIEELSLAALTHTLVGDYPAAIKAIEQAARVDAGEFENDYANDRRWVHLGDSTHGYIAFAFLVMRTKRDPNNAVWSVKAAACSLLAQNLRPLPISHFFALASIFHIVLELFWLKAPNGGISALLGGDHKQPIEGKPLDVMGGMKVLMASMENRKSRNRIEPMRRRITWGATQVRRRGLGELLESTFALLTKYGQVYQLCDPHVQLCKVIYTMVTTRKCSLPDVNKCMAEARAAGTPYVAAYAGTLKLAVKGNQSLEDIEGCLTALDKCNAVMDKENLKYHMGMTKPSD